jgi:CHASE3 domain sensor protein
MDKPKSNRFVWIVIICVVIVALAAFSINYVAQGTARVQATMQAAKLGTGVP